MPGAFRIIAGDVNGDGPQDLAVSTGNIVHVFIGNGTGGFGPSTPFSTPSALQFELTDLNGDGRLDIAAAMNLGPGVAILLNGCGQPTGNLVLSAFDSPDPVAEGAPVAYSSTVTNAGASLATNVTLTETLAGQGVAGTPSSSQGACTISGNRLVTCNLGPLAPNASADVQVTFTPSVGGSLSTVIGVGSERPDSNPADNVVTLTTTVTAVGRQFEVTNTDNAGFGSLRQAILDSNADAGDRDQIVFNIPGSGVHTITLASPLPVLSQPVVIDGRTQPGFVGTPIIELNGNGLAANGLVLTGGNSIVRGLVINRFGGSGMLLQTNGGNVVEGNYIGTNTAGAAALPNSSHGIAVSSANNLIGGPTAAARNVISGNQGNGIRLESPAATANRLQGNYVGLNATGTAALANVDPTGGVLLFNGATANLIGGPEAGAGNVISGNAQRGIMISGGTASPDNVIQGNLVGTNPTGMVGLSNGTGIEVVNAPERSSVVPVRRGTSSRATRPASESP